MPIGSGDPRIVSSPAHLTHVSALSGPSIGSYPASYAGRPAEEPTMRSRFHAALSAAGVRFLGHPAPAGEFGLPHGRLTGHRDAGPHRGCHVAHEQDTGLGAPLTPRTAVRSRPAVGLRRPPPP